MLDLVLDPFRLTILLVLLAIATPVVAWLGRKQLRSRRLILLTGASGPAILALWGVHNLVLEIVGFASVWSALLLLALAIGSGAAAGWWLAGDSEQDSKG